MNGNMTLGARIERLEKDGGSAIKEEIEKLSGEVETIKTEISKGHVYSTEEKVVGTWTDGNPVYEKVFMLENPTDSMILSENVEHLITQTGHWVQVENPVEEQLFPKEYSPTQSAMVGVNTNNLILRITGLNILRCTIIAQYTKPQTHPHLKTRRNENVKQ